MTTNDFPPQLVLAATDPGLPGDPVYLCCGQTRHRGPVERRPAHERGAGAGDRHACPLALPCPTLAHRRRSLDRGGGALLCADPTWEPICKPAFLAPCAPWRSRYGEKPFWPVWGALLHSVETGEPSFQHVFGLSLFDYYAQHPEEAELFNHMMTEWTASVAPTVAAAYDFSATQTLVDVGGGHGQMLASILQAHPTLHGVLFDLPHVVKGAPPLLERPACDRCEVIGGDAFTAVPADYETYLLSRVIHDWDDERAIAILARCHQAMKPQGKVLLVERVILTGRTPAVAVSGVRCANAGGCLGGKERTEAEYRALLDAAGFELTRLIPVLTTLLRDRGSTRVRS